MTFSLDNGQCEAEVAELCSLQSGLGQHRSLTGDCLQTTDKVENMMCFSPWAVARSTLYTVCACVCVPSLGGCHF